MPPKLDSWKSIIDGLIIESAKMPENPDEESLDCDLVETQRKLEVQRRSLQQCEALLERASALHHSDSARIGLLQKRVHNRRNPAVSLPCEVLNMIFRYVQPGFDELCLASVGWTPDILAAVCREWRKAVKSGFGARLRSNVLVSPHQPCGVEAVTRALSAAIAVSRTLPLHVCLKARDQRLAGHDWELNRDLRFLVKHLIFEKARARIRSLVIANVPYYEPFLPLLGHFSGLKKLRLDFCESLFRENDPHRTIPHMFEDVMFPSLRTFELVNITNLTLDDVEECFGATFPHVEELSLLTVTGTPDAVLALLGMFSEVHTAEFRHVYADPALSTEHLTVPMSQLRTLKCPDAEAAELVRHIVAPALEIVAISNDEGFDPGNVTLNPRLFPELRVVQFGVFYVDQFDFSALCAREGSLRLIHCQEGFYSLAEAVHQLHTYAFDCLHSSDTLDTEVSDDGTQDADGCVIFLDLDISKVAFEGAYGIECAKAAERFLAHLTILSAEADLCEQAFGRGFRVHLSEPLVNINPLIALAVQENPEFLRIGLPSGIMVNGVEYDGKWC